jgi:hypothetical protein
MRLIILYAAILLTITTSCNNSFKDYNKISDLSGTWDFQLDPDNVGIKENRDHI